MRRAAHNPDQGDAARFGGVIVAHRQPMKIKLFSQRQRHAAARHALGFGPVKRHAEERATGAATQARVVHRVDQGKPGDMPGARAGTQQMTDLTPAIAIPSRLTGKRIALSHVAAVQPGLEPFDPLRRRAVGK
jgi:hypothetical protein